MKKRSSSNFDHSACTLKLFLDRVCRRYEEGLLKSIQDGVNPLIKADIDRSNDLFLLEYSNEMYSLSRNLRSFYAEDPQSKLSLLNGLRHSLDQNPKDQERRNLYVAILTDQIVHGGPECAAILYRNGHLTKETHWQLALDAAIRTSLNLERTCDLDELGPKKIDRSVDITGVFSQENKLTDYKHKQMGELLVPGDEKRIRQAFKECNKDALFMFALEKDMLGIARQVIFYRSNDFSDMEKIRLTNKHGQGVHLGSRSGGYYKCISWCDGKSRKVNKEINIKNCLRLEKSKADVAGFLEEVDRSSVDQLTNLFFEFDKAAKVQILSEFSLRKTGKEEALLDAIARKFIQLNDRESLNRMIADQLIAKDHLFSISLSICKNEFQMSASKRAPTEKQRFAAVGIEQKQDQSKIFCFSAKPHAYRLLYQETPQPKIYLYYKEKADDLFGQYALEKEDLVALERAMKRIDRKFVTAEGDVLYLNHKASLSEEVGLSEANKEHVFDHSSYITFSWEGKMPVNSFLLFETGSGNLFMDIRDAAGAIQTMPVDDELMTKINGFFCGNSFEVETTNGVKMRLKKLTKPDGYRMVLSS